jgi:lipopolysaccharide export system ATP-binding protein
LCICDMAYILNNGEVIESGSPETIARSEIARNFYLGKDFCL